MEAGSRPSTTGYALLAGCAVLVALSVLAIGKVHRDGVDSFYGPSDPRYFRVVATAPFGDGQQFVAIGHADEASYRYGRIGLPLTAWIGALGRPGHVGESLIAINVIAIAAVPLLAGLYLAALGRDARLGLLVLLAPGLLLVYDRPYAEPFTLALVLAAFLLCDREHRVWAVALTALAICSRESAAIVLVAFVWRDVRVRDRRVWTWGLALVPYAAWCVWVRVRVGEFPFLANTLSRREALSGPFVGWKDALAMHTTDGRIAVLVVATTVVVGIVAGWYARSILAGAAAFAAALLALCTGPNTLRYLGETLRVLAFTQVLALVSIGYLVRWPRDRARAGDDVAVRGRGAT